MTADQSGRAVQGVGLRPLACWNCGFESQRGHGCLSLVNVVCCQIGDYVSEESRRVLPNVECLSVITKHRQIGGPGTLGGGA